MPRANMQHPTQGFPSSSSPNSDLESMKSAQNAAISSNEKVFPIFAKKLASKDTKEFANTARKLAEWLASEKAYYLAARPKIVELLEIALSAFTDTFVHLPASAEFGELLRKLVQTVVPFKYLFSERELQSRLERVIIDMERSISTLSTRAIQPLQGVITASSPSLIVPVNVHRQPNIPPIPGPSTSRIQPVSTLGPVEAAPDSSFREGAPRAHNAAEFATGADPSLASVTNTPRESGESIPPSIPSKPQPRRARKAELSEELIARDLDWFKSNKASLITSEDLSQPSESSSALAPDASHVPKRSPSPKKKSARIVPSRRLPRRIPPETALKSGSFPPPSEPSTAFDAQITAVPDARQEPPSLLNESPVELVIAQTEHHSPSAKAASLNGESAISPRPSIPRSDTILGRTDWMDVSPSDLGSDRFPSEPSHRPESTPPQSPQVFRIRSPILPPLVGALDPALNLNFNPSQIASGQPQQSASGRRFDGEMTVIHSIQGKPFTHTHMLDISLAESMVTKISYWVNRRSRPSEAPQGVCISLACYRLPGFFDQIKAGSGEPDIQALTLHSSCSWPYSSRLSMHVNDETRHTIITLSPPLFLTSDQCVDISSLMKPGNNTLEIRQEGDLSQYLVVFHAHRPTRVQLSELNVVNIADERWKRFLDVVSARVTPGKALGTGPAGAVGVF